jgi:catecholate siderophore receptor
MLMRPTCNIIRPRSLRSPRQIALAATLAGAASLAPQAQAQAQQASAPEQEVQLGTLKIEGRTADVNPHATPGAPYKAQTSGDIRRTKPLAETPATIAVITETQIKESGRTDLKAILAAQPGVTVGTGENGNKFGDRYVLRGQELKSDVFVDGLRDPGMTIRESFNVDQVELTKGPSSTFAGRGSSGGAVNAITKQASLDYNFLNTDITGGTSAYVRTTADGNYKLSDKAAVRVNALFGSEGVPTRAGIDRKRFGGAISTLYKPTANLAVNFDYYHLTAHDTPDLGTWFSGAGGKVVSGTPAYAQAGDFLHSSVNVATLREKWDVGGGLKIENATRYGSAHNGYVTTSAGLATRSAADPTAPGVADGGLESSHTGWQNIEYVANQLNALYDTKLGGMRHQFVLGGEYSYNRVLNGTYTATYAGAKTCATGTSTTLNSWCILNGATNLSTLQGRSYTVGAWNVDWKVNTISAYAMDTVDVTKWLALFGGVRLDHYTYDLATNSAGTVAAYGYSGNLWNYHGGITITPRKGRMIYASIGSATNINGGESDVGTNCGYGGFCTVTGTGYYGSPVKTTNYELGTKWEIGDDLLISASLYRLYKDGTFQSATGDSYQQTGTLNTGRYRVQGAEISLVGNIGKRLSGSVGASFGTSKVLTSTTAADIGHKLSNFANNQANAQLKYQLTKQLAVGGNVNYKSSMAAGQPDTAAVYSTAIGNYSYQVPAYTTFDAFATYKINSHLETRVNVQNLTDKEYYTASYRAGKFVYEGDRRRLTVTLSGKF